MSGKFLVKLADAHKKSGLTPYAVAQETGLNENTVRNHVTENVYCARIYPHIVVLAEFYGLNWRDPAVIEWVSDKETEDPETKTPHAIPA